MIKLELNENEANALLQLIDSAVRMNGMGAAEAALVLTRKIKQAAEAMQKAQSPNVIELDGNR